MRRLGARLSLRLQQLIERIGGTPVVLAFAVVLVVVAVLVGGRLLYATGKEAAHSADAAEMAAEDAADAARDSAALLRLAAALTDPQGPAAQRALEQRQDIIDRLDRIHSGLLAEAGELEGQNAQVLAELAELRRMLGG